MWTTQVSWILHRTRILLSLSFLLCLAYFVVYSWLVIPSISLYVGWENDTVLAVLPADPDRYGGALRAGDVILAIDEVTAQRGESIFQPPVKEQYDLLIERVGSRLEIPVSVSLSLVRRQIATTAILSTLLWLVGFIIVAFMREFRSDTLYSGFGFQLIGVGIMSAGPTQLGAPGAWIFGQGAIFFFPLILFFLSLVPRNKPLSKTLCSALKGVLIFCTLLAIAGIVEELFLFPKTSFQGLIGFSPFHVLIIATVVVIVLALATMLVRLLGAKRESYERRQLTLLLGFLVLGTLPILVFLILPEPIYIPILFPFLYSLLLLIPAGYFFVLHRQGYLILDAIFGRVITVVVLIVAIAVAYGTGASLFSELLGREMGSVGQGSLLLALVIVAIAGQQPVQFVVDALLYGSETIGPEALREAATRLSANPDATTMGGVMAQIASRLNVDRVALLVREREQLRLLVANDELDQITLDEVDSFQSTCLRAAQPACATQLPDWVELSLPVAVRGNTHELDAQDLLGVLLLSRPGNGYFNRRQVEALEGVTDILVFGLQVLTLIDAVESLSRKMMYETEVERLRLATQIHNEPLQTLSFISNQLDTLAEDEAVRDVARTLRRVTKDMRRIIAGMRPAALTRSMDLLVGHVVRDFAEQHHWIEVKIDLDVPEGLRLRHKAHHAVYYVLTEALNNISKHAQASEVRVSVQIEDETLVLEVEDNGVGGAFTDRSLSDFLRDGHIGLADMHRWALVGTGHLSIRPGDVYGTCMRLMLPLEAQ